MGKRIRIKIPVEPKPKGRPRVTFKNGFVRTYTPGATQAAEEELRAYFVQHREKAFMEHEPVKMSITFYRRRSKWKPKNNPSPYDKLLPVRKPDIDNFAKMVLDAANGILFVDDAQITKLILAKRWSENGNSHADGYITIDMELDKCG